MADYFIVRSFIRYGFWLIALELIAGSLLVGWLAATVPLPLPVLVISILAVLLLGMFTLLLLELTKIIAEMLLPR